MDNHLFKIHHKVKLQLDAICQEAGDMDVEEFMEVYKCLEDVISPTHEYEQSKAYWDHKQKELEEEQDRIDDFDVSCTLCGI